MPSSYPTGFDNFATVDPTDTTTTVVGGRTHRASHNDMGDAIEAVQAELGATPSGSAASVAARLSGIEAGTRLFAGYVLVRYNAGWPASRPAIPSTWRVILDAGESPAAVPPAWGIGGDLWIADGTTPWGLDSPINLVQGNDYTAAGVILVGTGAGTVGPLPVGATNGLALVVDLTAPQKVKWANATGTATTVTKTSNYTATTNDHTIRVDSTSGNVTIALPAASGNTGRIFVIKKIASANTVTVDPSGAETIDGNSTIALASQYELVRVQCNGTSWDVI